MIKIKNKKLGKGVGKRSTITRYVPLELGVGPGMPPEYYYCSVDRRLSLLRAWGLGSGLLYLPVLSLFYFSVVTPLPSQPLPLPTNLGLPVLPEYQVIWSRQIFHVLLQQYSTYALFSLFLQASFSAISSALYRMCLCRLNTAGSAKFTVYDELLPLYYLPPVVPWSPPRPSAGSPTSRFPPYYY